MQTSRLLACTTLLFKQPCNLYKFLSTRYQLRLQFRLVIDNTTRLDSTCVACPLQAKHVSASKTRVAQLVTVLPTRASSGQAVPGVRFRVSLQAEPGVRFSNERFSPVEHFCKTALSVSGKVGVFQKIAARRAHEPDFGRSGLCFSPPRIPSVGEAKGKKLQLCI